MRRGVWLMTLGALSCAGAPPVAQVTPAPAPAIPSATTERTIAEPARVTVGRPDASAETPGLDAACEKLEASQRIVLRRARTESEELRGTSDRVPPVMGTCLRQPKTHGAWMIALDAMTSGGCPERTCGVMRFHLVHLDDQGASREGSAQTITFASGALTLDIGALVDWDGDGTPEILVRTSNGHVACGRATTAIEKSASLWFFHTDGVSRSPLSVEDARDVDQDGRIDLVTRGPYAAVADRPCMAGALGDTSITLLGPELVLRSRPDGSFVMSPEDAKRACPEAPPAVVARPKKGRLELPLTARNVACARIWGVPTADITSELDRHRAQLCDQERGRCAEIDILRDWATKDPPLTLAR